MTSAGYIYFMTFHNKTLKWLFSSQTWGGIRTTGRSYKYSDFWPYSRRPRVSKGVTKECFIKACHVGSPASGQKMKHWKTLDVKDDAFLFASWWVVCVGDLYLFPGMCLFLVFFFLSCVGLKYRNIWPNGIITSSFYNYAKSGQTMYVVFSDDM